MLKSIDDNYDDIEKQLNDLNDELTEKLFSFDRNDLKSIIQFLKPFKDASDDLEGDTCCTIHKVALWYYTIVGHCSVPDSASTPIPAIVKELNKQANHYLKLKFLLSDEHKVATFLSPRHKKLRMFSEDERSIIYNIVYVNG